MKARQQGTLFFLKVDVKQNQKQAFQKCPAILRQWAVIPRHRTMSTHVTKEVNVTIEMLTDIVGFREDEAQIIFESFSSHETELDSIIRMFLIINESQHLDDQDLTLEEHIECFGFTVEISADIAHQIRCKDIPANHYSPSDYVSMYVEDKFYDYITPYEIPAKPDWSQGHGLDKEYFAKTLESSSQIRCKNFTNVSKARHFVTADCNVDSQFEWWFHGTSSMAAYNILNVGILPNRGFAKKDFSDGYGFYLSNQYEPAFHWTQKRFRNKESTAIIRFKVPKNILTPRKNGIVLSQVKVDDMNKWREIVRHNRSQGLDSRHLKQMMESATFIIGPLSVDGSWHVHKDNPGWPRMLNNSWRQLCLCSVDICNKFNQFIDRCVIIEKQ